MRRRFDCTCQFSIVDLFTHPNIAHAYLSGYLLHRLNLSCALHFQRNLLCCCCCSVFVYLPGNWKLPTRMESFWKENSIEKVRFCTFHMIWLWLCYKCFIAPSLCIGICWRCFTSNEFIMTVYLCEYGDGNVLVVFIQFLAKSAEQVSVKRAKQKRKTQQNNKRSW